MLPGYVCKIADLSEMERKWDYEIAHAGEARPNWVIWRESMIRQMQEGQSIPYYGILNGEIICEATAGICPKIVPNAENLVGDETAYLCAFRTIEAYQGKGYFSELFRFLLDDLKKRGYTSVTVGVEPHETKNRAIYHHYGFDQFIKTATETYPDQTVITVDYYRKKL